MINQASRRAQNPARLYTYPQLTTLWSATSPGSILDRHSGSDLDRRGHTAGLDAVLVAVELALESAPPSGKVSVEHVINVLSRLNPAPTPDDAQTSLQATVAPLANTARYDSLRGQGGTEEINHA